MLVIPKPLLIFWVLVTLGMSKVGVVRVRGGGTDKAYLPGSRVWG